MTARPNSSAQAHRSAAPRLTLLDALAVVQRQERRQGEALRAFLAVGSTALHLRTFLSAHLAQRVPERSVNIDIGPYGDVLGAVDAAAASGAANLAVVLEWSDLDPRLGLRRTGGWHAEALADAMAVAEQRLAALLQKLRQLTHARVALALPSLALPPAFVTPGWQSSALELRLREAVHRFAAAAADLPHLAVANASYLDALSPAGRRDVAHELAADFPYTLAHAAALAETLALLLHPSAPLKGLITDLDDTLWAGLVGEIGPANVSWSHDRQSHIHALYQQFLDALAKSGTLVAIASKNDPDIVQQALARADLLIDARNIFPVEAGWGAKSAAVGRILGAWNIAPDAVAFVDDSPMEVAEVRGRFPGLHGFVFPTGEDAAVMELLGRLRDLFGKSAVGTEDKLRLASIKAQTEVVAERARHGEEDFLASLKAEISFDFRKDPADRRPLELINKTNQFTLNGARIDEGRWLQILGDPRSFLLTASYTDKFGPLGKIAVAYGRIADEAVLVDGWALSCRAFARRIEHAMLQALLERFPARAIRLAFARTERNSPAQSFFVALDPHAGSGPLTVTAASFKGHRPPLHHAVTVHG